MTDESPQTISLQLCPKSKLREEFQHQPFTSSEITGALCEFLELLQKQPDGPWTCGTLQGPQPVIFGDFNKTRQAIFVVFQGCVVVKRKEGFGSVCWKGSRAQVFDRNLFLIEVWKRNHLHCPNSSREFTRHKTAYNCEQNKFSHTKFSCAEWWNRIKKLCPE